MRSPRTQWPRPSHASGLLAIAGVLGAWAMAAQPAPARRGGLTFGGAPTAGAFRMWVVPPRPPMVFAEPPAAVDHCLIPAPDIDERFVVPAPRVDDRAVVAPRVRGMPVRSYTTPRR